MSKNLCGKTRKLDDPYETWKSFDGSWTWRILKKYQSQEAEDKNPEARWYCAVQSPMTYGGWEHGDVWVRDIKKHAQKVILEDAHGKAVVETPEI
jgi:hypothetical protein